MFVDLILDWSHDPKPARDIEVVTRSTLSEFNRIFTADPLAGKRPIHVSYRSDGPFNDSTKDTNVYSIYLAVRDRAYPQLSFQLGHELCHIIADPRSTNWFVESCCDMVSLILLRRMSKVWDCKPPFRNWSDYAPRFEEYAQNHIHQAITKVFQSESLPYQSQVHKWLASVNSSFRPCPTWRERNVIIAEMLRPLFEESRANWDSLRFLGQASASPPVNLTDLDMNSDFKFDKWLEAVPEHLKDLVRRIRYMFENATQPNNG